MFSRLVKHGNLLQIQIKQSGCLQEVWLLNLLSEGLKLSRCALRVFVRHCLVLWCHWGDIFLSMYKPTYLVDVQYNSPTFSFLFSGLLWFVEGMLVLNTCYFSATLDFFNSSYDVWVANRFKGIGLKISMTHPIKKLQTFYSDSVWQETNRTEKPCFSPFFSTVLWSRCELPPESVHSSW